MDEQKGPALLLAPFRYVTMMLYLAGASMKDVITAPL